MELINREESKLSQLFYLDTIPSNELVKIDNPGGGECLYTSIINFLRIEFIVKKELYKKDKRNEQKKKIFFILKHAFRVTGTVLLLAHLLS